MNGEELKNSPTPLLALSGMMVEQAATSESPQQDQEHLQNAKQLEEVIQVQHQDQAKIVTELHTFHSRYCIVQNDGG